MDSIPKRTDADNPSDSPHDPKADQLAQAREKARKSEKNAETTAAELLPQLLPDHRPKVKARLAEMPRKSRPVYLRAMTGRSRTAAIRAFCAECMGWEGLPDSVRECTSPACPLYPYRPGAQP